ncbi:MAG: nucleotidyltransferase domain-containing protein [bacterium]|nr:nucleotidyltransferase domain-containing protein [bacterium]
METTLKEMKRDLRTKLNEIVDYLKASGCSKIVLFGSMAEGMHHLNSDIDIAVSGISNKEFFKAVASLSFIVKHRVDLVDFEDLPSNYRKNIEANGVLLYAS